MNVMERELARVKTLAQQAAQEQPEDIQIMSSGLETRATKPMTKDTAYEEVLAHYTLPFPLYPFQVEVINDLAQDPRVGLYMDMGTGKTIVGSSLFLFKLITGEVTRAVVIVPPILITQWSKHFTMLGITTQEYKGTPAQRRKIKLGETQTTIVSIDVFKNDIERFNKTFGPDTLAICDEAHSLKNVSTHNHRLFRNFTADKSLSLLTGTPITKPDDAYAFISLVSPGIYRNKTQFNRLHQGDKDFWGTVITYRNLDLMNENLALNSTRILIGDVVDDLPPHTFPIMHYSLDPKHKALYEKLATEQLLILEGENGGKIDATTPSALFHKLGQIVNNWDYFADNPKLMSQSFYLVDQIMEELGEDGKLIVFANYRMTNKALTEHLQKFNAVSAFGDNSGKQNMANIELFKDDPKVRILVAQPTSGGQGVDGLQDVCWDSIFLEMPNLRQFRQAAARLYRVGQRNPVRTRIAVAQGTLQQRQLETLMATDETANKVIRNVKDLRKALFGE